MVKITPIEFKDAFLKCFKSREDDIVNRWNGSETLYSHLIRDDILVEMGKLLGLIIYNADYYTLDCIYYKEKEIDKLPSHHTYTKYISIALKHENSLDSSLIEINNLQLINTPLKVLLTYARRGPNFDEYIARYTKIMREADVFNDFSTTRRQLLIFGDLPGDSPIWSFYVYENEGFIEI